jgi:hypothetical protein
VVAFAPFGLIVSGAIGSLIGLIVVTLRSWLPR